MGKNTNTKETQMATLADIKRYAKDNQIDGYMNAYNVVNSAIEFRATYKRGGLWHGKPAVIPTKARTAEEIAAHWSNTGGEFGIQAAYIARALAAYYTTRGI